MLKVVTDTTILISAFLKYIPGGAAYDLLQSAAEAFELFLSDDIIEETARVLLDGERNRRRYGYTDIDVTDYCQYLTELATLVDHVRVINVVRDPNDDMILACAIAAKANYLVTRDKDLLVLETYEDIKVVTPEAFLQLLRSSSAT